MSSLIGGGGGADAGNVTLQAGDTAQVILSVEHPASIKSLTLVDRGNMALDLTNLTSLKTFIQDNGGGSFLQSFPFFPTSIEWIQMRGCGYYFGNVNASSLVNLTHLDCQQAGQIGVNGGAIALPATNKLTYVNFGACNLPSGAIDALLDSVVTNCAPGCTVYVDGPGNADPSPGDRSTTGAVEAADWAMTPDGTYGRYWSVLVGETTYYLYKILYGNWVIAPSLTLDIYNDPYWTCANQHSLGIYEGVNGQTGSITVDFDAGPSGMKSIVAIIAAGGSVTYNNNGYLPW